MHIFVGRGEIVDDMIKVGIFSLWAHNLSSVKEMSC